MPTRASLRQALGALFILQLASAAAAQPTVQLRSPVFGSSVEGEVELRFDLDLATSGSVEYSTDGGVTFAPCTAHGCSAFANPLAGFTTPASNMSFVWNSYDDGVAFGQAQPTILRVYASGSTGTAMDQTSLILDNTTRTRLEEPACGTAVAGLVILGFDADDVEGDPLTTTFQYSTDSGATFLPCTPASASPLQNPAVAMPSPVFSESFVWNSYDDGVARMSSQTVSIGLSTGDSASTAVSTSEIEVDNSGVVFFIREPGFGETRAGLINLELYVDFPPSGDTPVLEAPHYSLDGGTSWQQCSGQLAGGFPLPYPLPSAAVSVPFTWNSIDDEIAFCASTEVTLRMVLSLPTATLFSDELRFFADNSAGTICGDCDEDLAVGTLDVLAAAQHAAGVTVLSHRGLLNCDVAAPARRVGVLDALNIARYAVGLGSLSCCP